DVGPQTALGYIEKTEEKMAEIGIGRFASISGRYYAMDRDKRWDRAETAYRVLVDGVGLTAASATEGLVESYDQGVMDEFVVPYAIVDEGEPVATIKSDDSIIFFNFRPDRAIQLTSALITEDFNSFPLSVNQPKNLT